MVAPEPGLPSRKPAWKSSWASSRACRAAESVLAMSGDLAERARSGRTLPVVKLRYGAAHDRSRTAVVRVHRFATEGYAALILQSPRWIVKFRIDEDQLDDAVWSSLVELHRSLMTAARRTSPR